MNRSTAQSLRLSPSRARGLVAATYLALIVGYLLDLVLGPLDGGPGVAVSALKLAGLVGCGVIFLTTFSFTANAPDHQIDERERAERNAVYFRAYQVVIGAVFLLFLAMIGIRLLTDWAPTVGTIEELLTLLGIGGLALPAALLAWRSSVDDEER